MKLWKNATEWLLDTKGHPLDELRNRREFLRRSGLTLGALMSVPLVGCGNEPAADDNYSSEGTPSGSSCEVQFPTGFYCDANSEAGAKHTPVISSMSNDAESYSLSISVPHVVNPDHHILGCQIVGYTPGAVNPHAWLDFHYYTNEYILSADDTEWTHDFQIAKAGIDAATTHLMVFSICNKHGNYGEFTAL